MKYVKNVGELKATISALPDETALVGWSTEEVKIHIEILDVFQDKPDGPKLLRLTNFLL